MAAGVVGRVQGIGSLAILQRAAPSEMKGAAPVEIGRSRQGTARPRRRDKSGGDGCSGVRRDITAEAGENDQRQIGSEIEQVFRQQSVGLRNGWTGWQACGKDFCFDEGAGSDGDRLREDARRLIGFRAVQRVSNHYSAAAGREPHFQIIGINAAGRRKLGHRPNRLLRCPGRAVSGGDQQREDASGHKPGIR